jgi:hypothetical protein
MGRSCGATRLALSAELVRHHVNDTLHPLDDIIGFGRVGLRLFAGARGDTRRRRDLHASSIEVVVKEPNQISMGLARMSAMLIGKRTPDWAAMLHSEFLISPTLCANCQGMRPGQIRKGDTQAVVG